MGWVSGSQLKAGLEGVRASVEAMLARLREELLAQLEAHPAWRLRERVLLAAALRFTSSRRAEAAVLAELVEAGRARDGKEAAVAA